MNPTSITLLDGPLGTELNRRGVETPEPLWSAVAIETHPEWIAAIHRDYAVAGATVHTANTFRTRRRTAGRRWNALTRQAIDIARRSVSPEHRIAGSLAPLEDCYRPDLSPADSEPEHREMADALAAAGCDLILCETFPHPEEALTAARSAVRTGLPTWLSLTAGPYGTLMTPQTLAETACRAVDLGVTAVLVNCTAADMLWRWIDALAATNVGVPFGGYANAGDAADRLGWGNEDASAAGRYLRFAEDWVASGARLVGGCCGTGPEHIAALKSLHRQK